MYRDVLEITLDKINMRDEPYQLFLDSIKSPLTKRKYKNMLYRFLKLIPNQLYEDNIGYIPEDRKDTTLAKCFVNLAKDNAELAANVIAAYIKEDIKIAKEGKIAPQTVPNHIKPIKVLLDSNQIPIHWKSLNRLLPRSESKSKDRAYTREEIQRMLEVSKDITDNVIVLLFSSAGFRLEAWDYFTWQDVIFFKTSNGTCKGAALLIYRGDPESYWTFITPEACAALEMSPDRHFYLTDYALLLHQLGYPGSDTLPLVNKALRIDAEHGYAITVRDRILSQ